MQYDFIDIVVVLYFDWQLGDIILVCLVCNVVEYFGEIVMCECDWGIWQEYDWCVYLVVVIEFVVGFEVQGIGFGDVVMVIGDNCLNLYFVMLGIVCLWVIFLFVYVDVLIEELVVQMVCENICIVIVEDQEQVDKMLEVCESWFVLGLVVYDDLCGFVGCEFVGVMGFDVIWVVGVVCLLVDLGLCDVLIVCFLVYDIVVLMYFLGIMGVFKGILLKYGYVLLGVRNVVVVGYFWQGEVYMVYLLMVWVGDFIFLIGVVIELCFSVNIFEVQEIVLYDLCEIVFLLYFVLFWVWLVMLICVQVGMVEIRGVKCWFYDWFMFCVMVVECVRLMGKFGQGGLMCWLGEWLICGLICDQLGFVCVQCVYIVGEVIGEDVFLWFCVLGLNLCQFYGQIENCVLVVVQGLDDIFLIIVGCFFFGIDMCIDEIGQILLCGDNIFDGYFQNFIVIVEVLVDGWLQIGDVGQIEFDGQFVVLGCVFEVVEKCDGMCFILIYIENWLKFLFYIKDVVVIGCGCDMLVVIVCIDFQVVG